MSTFAGARTGGPGFANGYGTDANFYFPEGLVTDAANNLFVVDYMNNMIRKVTPYAYVTTLAGKLGGGAENGTGEAAGFSHPSNIAINAAGSFYATDTDNSIIRKISPDGLVSTIAGNGTLGYKNGKNLEASFNRIRGIAVDSRGVIYVCDQ